MELQGSSLVPISIARNWNELKYYRQAAGLPVIAQPEIVAVDNSPHNGGRRGGTHGEKLMAVGLFGAAAVLFLFSFRIEPRGRRE